MKKCPFCQTRLKQKDTVMYEGSPVHRHCKALMRKFGYHLR